MTYADILVILMLNVIVNVLYFRSLHRERAPVMVRAWRDNGRQWALFGQADRSRWCHEHADWWDQDWWASMITRRPANRPPSVSV